VKHLNPRQGITTVPLWVHVNRGDPRIGVKHLNPRQGITTDEQMSGSFWETLLGV